MAELVNHPKHYGGAENPYEAITNLRRKARLYRADGCTATADEYDSTARLIEDLEARLVASGARQGQTTDGPHASEPPTVLGPTAPAQNSFEKVRPQ